MNQLINALVFVLSFVIWSESESDDINMVILKVVAVASLPKEIAAGLQPKQNNSIRGLLLQSGWVVEKLDDDSCMVTYVVQVWFKIQFCKILID